MKNGIISISQVGYCGHKIGTNRGLLLFSWLLLVSFISSAQDSKNRLANEQWLKMITANAITKSDKPNIFYKPNPGYALYFSQSGNVSEPYLVYVPKSYNPTHANPVIVFLHGAILAREEFQYKNAENAAEPIFSIADDLNSIIIFPFARQDFRWAGQSPAFENIMNMIRQVESTYNVDKKKIYIGGISMGGNATYWFINNKPEVFAGFYTVSALPGADVKFSNITPQKPLYSINAKDDGTFPFPEVNEAHEQYKSKTTGWHFTTVETGGHRFIYAKEGRIYLKKLIGDLMKDYTR